jgi:hypothetical protein
VAVVIMGGLTIWQIGSSANQICRQVHHLHRRMDEIHEELQNANSHLRSIESDTDRMPKVRESYIDDYPA